MKRAARQLAQTAPPQRDEAQTAPAQSDEALRAEVFGSVFVLAQHLGRTADAALAPLSLTSKQWLLLAVLQKQFRGRSPTLGEAAQCYGSSRQNVKQLALQLQAQGYLRIVKDAEDARVLRLCATPRVAVFDTPSQRARQRAHLQALFTGLRDEELRTLRRLLHKCIAGLAPT